MGDLQTALKGVASVFAAASFAASPAIAAERQEGQATAAEAGRLTQEQRKALATARNEEIAQNRAETTLIVNAIRAGKCDLAVNLIKSVQDKPELKNNPQLLEKRLQEIRNKLQPEGRAILIRQEGLTPEQKTEIIALVYSKAAIEAASKVKALVAEALKPDSKITAATFEGIAKACGNYYLDIKNLLGPTATEQGLTKDLATIFARNSETDPKGIAAVEKAYRKFN